MTEILAVALKESKSLLRDFGALVMLFVLPGMFIIIMSVALQGAFSTEDTGERFAVLFVDESDGPWAEELVTALKGAGRFRVVDELDGRPVERATAERLIKRGTYRIGVVVPRGVDEAVDLEARSQIDVLVDPTLSRAYAISVQSAVEGVAFASTIEDLVDETRELGEQATKAADAVEELRTKLEEVGDQAQGCVDNLEKAQETINFLDGKLRSVKTKLRAAGFTAEQIPALGGASRPKSDGKEGGKEAGDRGRGGQKKVSAPERDAAQERRPRGERDVDAGRAIRTGDAGVGERDADVDSDGDVDADTDGAPLEGAGAEEDDEERRGVMVEQIYVSAQGGATPNSVQQQVPGWTIFALFWIVQILAVNMIRERESGAFRRILVSPVPLWKYVLGATTPFFFVNIAQAVVMFAIGVYLLPYLGCPSLEIRNVPALAVVTVGVSFSALTLGLLMASLSRSVFFAASVSAILITIMAILGGIMVPRVIMPGYMQEMGLIVPHGWALDGYLDVLVRGDGVAEVLDTFYALFGFSVLFFLIAVVRLRQLSRVR